MIRTALCALFGAIAVFSTSVPAFAEVCDKERPLWNRADGPVTSIDELYFFFASPTGLVLLIAVAVALYFRKLWLSIIVLILLVLAFLLSISIWKEFDDVTEYAIREGCVTKTLLPSIVLAIMAAGLLNVELLKLARKSF